MFLTLLVAGLAASSSAPVPAGGAGTARSHPTECAATLLARVTRPYIANGRSKEVSAWTHVRAATEPRWGALPFPIYRAVFAFPRPGIEILFAVEGDRCVLVRGDLEAVHGISAEFEAERAYALSQFNEAVTRTPIGTIRNRLSSDAGVLAYIDAVLALTSPSEASVLLKSASDVPEAAEADGETTHEDARAVPVRAPTVSRGEGIIRVDADTWENIGGVVWRNAVLVFPDGRVAAARAMLASGVGKFRAARVRL